MHIADKGAAPAQAVGRPTILVLAASTRAPAYEAQMRVLEEQSEELESTGVLVACILKEGESRIGTERLEPGEAAEIRRRYSRPDDAFQIVVLSENGEVVRTDDAPLQGKAILDALGAAGKR